MFLCAIALCGVLLPAEAQIERGYLPPIVVSTDIRSTPEIAWATLMDFRNYPAWNRWVVRLEGPAELHGRVRAYNREHSSLDLQITVIEPLRRICWVDVSSFTRYGMGGWRCRSIEPLPGGRGIRFTNHFQYTGPLALVLMVGTLHELFTGMRLENRSLKTFLESR